MLLSKCVLSDSKKYRLTKEQEASELFRSLGLKTPKIPLLIETFFYWYKMNKIVNMFSLVQDKFMPEM